MQLADEGVAEGKMDISNAPTTGYVLGWNGTDMEWRAEGTTPTPTPTHTNYIGARTADANFVAADYTSSADVTTLTVPAYSGAAYISVAFPDTETLSELYVYQSGHRNTINQLSTLPTEATVQLGGSAHTSRTTGDAQTGLGGYIFELVFA